MSAGQDSKDDSSTRGGADEPANLRNVEREFQAIDKLVAPLDRSGARSPGSRQSEADGYDVIQRSAEDRLQPDRSSSHINRTTIQQTSSRVGAYTPTLRGGDSIYSVQRSVVGGGGSGSGSTYSFEQRSGSGGVSAIGRRLDLGVPYTSSTRLGDSSSYRTTQRVVSGVSSADQRALGTYTSGSRVGDSSYAVRPTGGTDVTLLDRGRDIGAYSSTRRVGDTSHVYTTQTTSAERQVGSYAARPVSTGSFYADTSRRTVQSTGRGYVVDLNISVRPATKAERYESSHRSGKFSVPTATIDNVHYVDLNFETPRGTAKLYTDGILNASASSIGTSVGGLQTTTYRETKTIKNN